MATKTKAQVAPQATKPIGHDVDEFRAQFDRSYIVPRKIKDALQRLGNRWMREIDFARFAGIGSQEIAAFRSEFEADFVIEVGSGGKRVWAGTKALAAKLREIQQ